MSKACLSQCSVQLRGLARIGLHAATKTAQSWSTHGSELLLGTTQVERSK